MNNITFETIWRDMDFFEIRVTCVNNDVRACAECYVTDELVEELQSNIKKYIRGEITFFEWTIGDHNQTGTSAVTIIVGTKDKHGHVTIEVLMSIQNNGDQNRQTCHLFINTEMGILYNFKNKIGNLKSSAIGTTISLI